MRSRQRPSYPGRCPVFIASSLRAFSSSSVQKHSYASPAATRRSAAARYVSNRWLWKIGPSSQCEPSHCRTSWICATASCVERATSVSSMRRMNVPPVWRACNQLNSTVRAFPMWRNPVGAGENRTRTSLMMMRLRRRALHHYGLCRATPGPGVCAWPDSECTGGGAELRAERRTAPTAGRGPSSRARRAIP